MCGIVGYIGNLDAVELLLDGLSRLEYRGYDSAGLAVRTADASGETLALRKAVGKLRNLEHRLHDSPLSGTCGIGHTRWATHGAPSDVNCHPHIAGNGTTRVAVVHNGIIENYQALRDNLRQQGAVFISDTDTETIPHLIQNELEAGREPLKAVRRALRQASGAYALGILLESAPGRLFAARQGNPLIVGIGSHGRFIASDVPAVLEEIEEVIYLEDGQIAVLTADSVEIFDLEGRPVQLETKEVQLRSEEIDKGGFETFMLKEIHEQPRVLRHLIHQYRRREGPWNQFDPQPLLDAERIMIVGCGTAHYAGVFGKMVLEQLIGKPVESDIASEFRYRQPRLPARTLVIAVSQSGETADTLASIRLVRAMDCPVWSICNVEGSSLHRESDTTFFTQAGAEIGVASSKAFSAQLLMFILLGIELASDQAVKAKLLEECAGVPDKLYHVLERKTDIRIVADKHHDGPSALYLGRRFNYPIALEGALKNKEISYQHAEGYAAGEMKHGPIALINEYMPVVCICTATEDEVYEKMISNVKEVEARHGRIIALISEGDRTLDEVAEDVIEVPRVSEIFSPLVNVVALQVLAYYAATARGTDIDKPRNLAKSVTVE